MTNKQTNKNSLFFFLLQHIDLSNRQTYSILPVEVKSRVSINTAEEMTAQLRHVVGADDWDEQKNYMFVVKAMDKKLLKLLNSSLDPGRAKRELFQLLHHTFVFGVQEALLIVGTDTSFVYGVQVKFPLALIHAYERLISKCYNKWIKPFYAQDFDQIPMQKIERALEIRNANKMKKDEVDIHSFVTNYKLWRCLNIDIPSGIKFPLPPMRMIIPYVNAFWNCTKGPSDTMTRLLDSCEENLGIRSPQTIATARLFGILAVAFHRCHQVASSDKDAAFYQSMQGYRDAANQRSSFQKSMSVLVHFFKEELDSMTNKTEATPRSYPTTPPRPSTRSSRQVTAVTWHRKMKTGTTPKPCRRGGGGSAKALTDEARAASCIGLVPLLMENRRKCRLCNSQTFYVCSWCKRPLCLSRGRGLDEKIEKYANKYGIPTSQKPSKYVSLAEYDPEKEEKIQMQAINTCYHIAHAKRWQDFFSHLEDEADDIAAAYAFEINDENDKENTK